ncbi:MAG: hypothetical protein NTW99_14205 [Chloroflexi bacterium]|nr:hypothetical protein [Chloroflexota bacterium]
MDTTLGKFTFGKLTGFVLPGFAGSISLFFLIDSFMPSPGELFKKITITVTDLIAFSFFLLVIGIVIGIILDNLHHALLVPIYRRSKRFKKLEQQENPKIEMIKMLITDAVGQYGSHILKNKNDKKKHFKELLGNIKVDDLEWWFIFPLSGGSIYSLFVEEYYAPFQFFGSMTFTMIISCFASYFYVRNVLLIPDINIGGVAIPFTIITIIGFLFLALLCLQRAHFMKKKLLPRQILISCKNTVHGFC